LTTEGTGEMPTLGRGDSLTETNPVGSEAFALLKSESTEAVSGTVTNGAVDPVLEQGGSNEVNFARTQFLLNTAALYTEEKEYPEAEKAYLRALENFPGNPVMLFSLSSLYTAMGRHKESMDILKKLAIQFPDDPTIHNNLAWAYASTGGELKNAALALYHAREGIMSAPLDPAIWNTLAEAHYLNGDYKQALRCSVYAMEILRFHNAPETVIAEFDAQRIKIERTQESFSRLFGVEEEGSK